MVPKSRALILNNKQARIMERNIRNEFLNSKLGKKRKIPHAGDNKNYFLSNKFAALGIKPSKKIDRDQDGILDIEDCDPWDPKRQSFQSIVRAIKRKIASVKGSSSSSSSSSGTYTSSGGSSASINLSSGTSFSSPKSTTSSYSSSGGGGSSTSSGGGSSSSGSSGGGGSSTSSGGVYSAAPLSTVTAVQQKTGISGISQRLSQRRSQLQTQQARSRNVATNKKILARIGRGAGITALAATEDIVKNVEGGIYLVKSLPKASKAVLNALKDPKSAGLAIVSAAKEAPNAIRKAGKQTGYLLRTSPSEAVGVVAGEILFLKGTSKGLKVIGKATEGTLARLDPKFVGAVKNGEKVILKSSGKGSKTTLKIVGKLPRESLAKQVARSGRKIKTAVSSQAQELLRVIKNEKVIRKPIPGEEAFGKTTKELLKKFDNKKITSRELIKLDNLIKKKSGKGILERSFFADPTGKIRPSRLGITKDSDAKLIDLLSGDVTFKKPKPQILVFKDIKIEKLPKYLSSVKNKLKRGAALTKTEGEKLLKWQQRVTGKFKPVGFVSRESEITLAPGEVVKRVKKVGVVLIDGKKVPIVEAKVGKVKKITSNLLKKANKGSISKEEFTKLKKYLKRETGFNIPESSVVYKGKRVSLARLSGSLGISILSKKRLPLSKTGKSRKVFSKKKSPVSQRSPKSPVSPRSPKSPVSPRSPKSPKSKKSSSPSSPASSKVSSPKSTKSFSYAGSGGKSLRTVRGSPLVKRSSRKGKMIKAQSTQMGYHVYGRSGKRLIRLSRQPLKKSDAENRGAYAIDNTTAKTFIIKPAGRTKKLGQPKQFEKGYMKKTGNKFRSYRIKKGKAVSLKKERLIEKRKYGIDTRGEKRQLTLARFAKEKGFTGPKKKVTKKKIVKKKQASKSKPKYRTIPGGLFGPSRRVLIKPKTKAKKKSVKKTVKRKSIKRVKPRSRSRGIFG